jgi:hypothetical protein
VQTSDPGLRRNAPLEAVSRRATIATGKTDQKRRSDDPRVISATIARAGAVSSQKELANDALAQTRLGINDLSVNSKGVTPALMKDANARIGLANDDPSANSKDVGSGTSRTSTNTKLRLPLASDAR